jgi:hypothetical protein
VLPSPTALDRYPGNPADACALGYRMAAQALVEHACQPCERGKEAFLLYPIVFLYRHYVELVLKNVIIAFDEPEMRNITGAAELDRKKLTTGKNAHSLKLLWEQLRPLVQALGEAAGRPDTIEGISFYIEKLNEFDPYSLAGRYASEETTASLREAQKDDGTVDLPTFAEVMERLSNYLEGLDGYVAATIDSNREMLAEYEPCCRDHFRQRPARPGGTRGEVPSHVSAERYRGGAVPRFLHGHYPQQKQAEGIPQSRLPVCRVRRQGPQGPAGVKPVHVAAYIDGLAIAKPAGGDKEEGGQSLAPATALPTT